MGGAMPGVRSYGVDLEPGSSLRERIPGPYVAETFEVRVEEEYVVLEA
jgi:3-phenylpropionate/trans-cinnamate dioxygenase ferredoxin subunit